MAKLKGILAMEGSAGRFTFAKTEDGIIVKEKTGVSAERIATDPAYARTRENMREFGHAGKSAKLIFTTLRPAVYKASDKRASQRLASKMMQALKQDTTNARGDRNVMDGNLNVLKGFEFNGNAKLNASFFAPRGTEINREEGTLEITVPAFIPEDNVIMPTGATHFRLIAAALEANFTTDAALADKAISNYLPGNHVLTTNLTLTCNLTPESTDRFFLALGIEFYQLVNGQHYAFKDGAHNAFAIIALDV